LKKKRYLRSAWKEFMRIVKINIDFVQVNSAMPSVLSIPFPANFTEFTKAFDFINADFLSFTGATCVDGVNFMTRFGMMSLLPLFALLMGVAVYLKGRAKQIKIDTDALKRTAHEVFIMIDEDHSGPVDPGEYHQTFKHFDSTCDSSMHEGQFYMQLMTLDKKKLMVWWNKQKVISSSLNLIVQLFLLVHTPVTRKVFEYFNCHQIHSRAFLKQDYSIECNARPYNLFLSYVLAVGLAFTVGFPLLVAFYLHRHREQLYSGVIQAKVGFLYAGFNKGAEGWEVHEIVRKTLLTGVLIYLQDRPLVQASVAVAICTLSCCSLNYFQPQKNRTAFWLCQISFIATLLKFLGAIVLYGSSSDKEKNSVGSLLIVLDCLFFLSSGIGSFLAIHLLYKKIKNIDSKVKVSPVEESLLVGPVSTNARVEKAWDVETKPREVSKK